MEKLKKIMKRLKTIIVTTTLFSGVVISLVAVIIGTGLWATTYLYVEPPVDHVHGKVVWMLKVDRLTAETDIPFICRPETSVIKAGVFSQLTKTVKRWFSHEETIGAQILEFKYSPILYEFASPMYVE